VLEQHDISADYPLQKRLSVKARERESVAPSLQPEGPYLIFENKWDAKRGKLKTLLDRLSVSYNMAGNQSHFVNVLDSKAATRYIDDT
jgi:hypothetical protein